MKWLAKLNKSWLHFLVLGIIFFQFQTVMFPQPKTVIGPLAEKRLQVLQQQWFTRFGDQPSATQIAKMIADELDRDMLFQHALASDLHLHDKIVFDQLIRDMHFLNMAQGKSNDQMFEAALDMRLHLNDEVVKRRLIQEMQQRLLFESPPIMPSKARISEEFAARKDQFRRPSRYSIEHIFLSRDRESEATSVIAKIQQQGLNAKAARRLSSPFMSGYEFTKQTPNELAKNFGASFVLSLRKAGPVVGQWIGPINSIYGLHLVWVTEIEPERDALLEEAEPQLRRELEARARNQALQDAIAALRNDYEVRL
jgi:hypothetical protein